MDEYFIIDIRPEWRRHKYITFWRPDAKGYTWPLSWAGRYNKEQIDAEGYYYCNTNGSKELIRFPVLCDDVLSLQLTPPDCGDIDGDKGPVLKNSLKIRRKLRSLAYIPPNGVIKSVYE